MKFREINKKKRQILGKVDNRGEQVVLYGEDVISDTTSGVEDKWFWRTATS